MYRDVHILKQNVNVLKLEEGGSKRAKVWLWEWWNQVKDRKADETRKVAIAMHYDLRLGLPDITPVMMIEKFFPGRFAKAFRQG